MTLARLRAEIERHNRLYYLHDAPEVTDMEQTIVQASGGDLLRTSAPRMWEPAIDLLNRRALQLEQIIGEVITLEEIPDLLMNRSRHPRMLKRVVRVRE